MDTRYFNRTEPTLSPVHSPLIWEWRLFQVFWSGHFEPIEDEV